MSITTRLEKLSPSKAQKLLDSRAANRPLNKRHTRNLADAMLAGEFEVNGETIKIDEAGRMVDGQHRCCAVVISSRTVDTFVTRGLKEGMFDTIDTGCRRSVSNMFAKHGEKHYALLAGAVSWLMRHEQGWLETGTRQAPRHPEAMALLEEHPGIRDSLQCCQKMQGLCPSSMAVCLHYLFAQKDPDAADKFWELLLTGENLTKSGRHTSGIYLLRNRLVDNQIAKAKLPALEIWRLIVKAWNATRDGRVLKLLSMKSGEEHPVIQ